MQRGGAALISLADRRETPVDGAAARSPLRSAVYFLLHQLSAMLGVGICAYFSGILLLDVLDGVGLKVPGRLLSFILTETPYFPIQTVLGLFTGWSVARRLGHRMMRWVWVFPLILLGFAMATIKTLLPGVTSVLLQSGVTQSPGFHYLGAGCRVRDGCLDQLLITMPFYSSVAYSLGAWWAMRNSRERF